MQCGWKFAQNQSRFESIRQQLLTVFAWIKRGSSSRSVALPESTRFRGQGHDLVLPLNGIYSRIGTSPNPGRDVGVCHPLHSVVAVPFLSFVGLVLLESPWTLFSFPLDFSEGPWGSGNTSLRYPKCSFQFRWRILKLASHSRSSLMSKWCLS